MKKTLYEIIYYDSEENICRPDVKVSPAFLKGLLPRVRSGAVFIPSECKKYLPPVDKIDLQDMIGWNTTNSPKNTPLVVANEHSTFIPADDMETIATMIEAEAERRPVYVIEDKNHIFLYMGRAVFFAPNISLTGTTSATAHEYQLNERRIDSKDLREYLLKKDHGITIIPEDLEIEIEKNALSLPLQEFVLCMCAEENTAEDLQYLASTYQVIELYDVSRYSLIPVSFLLALSSFTHVIFRITEQVEFRAFEPEQIDRVTILSDTFHEDRSES